MDGRPSLRKEGGQNPAYRSTHYPLTHLERARPLLHLPYHELPVKEPGEPDTRSPLRFLLWLARHQKNLLFWNAFFGIGWMVSQALLWAAVGAAIDHGIARHSESGLLLWVAIVMALGLFQAICGSLRHQLAVTNWMNAAYRTVQVIGHHIARTGNSVTDEIQSGDVVNTVAAHWWRVRRSRTFPWFDCRLDRRFNHSAFNISRTRSDRPSRCTNTGDPHGAPDDPSSRYPGRTTRGGGSPRRARIRYRSGFADPTRNRGRRSLSR